MHQQRQPPKAQKLVKEAWNYPKAALEAEACVDEHAVDQLIIFMALAAGVSKVRTVELTEHTRTAMHFAQECTGARFEVSHVGPNLLEINCEGIGWMNQRITK